MIGSGKSYLGNLLAGRNVFKSEEDPCGITKKISSEVIEIRNNKCILYDTPGIGDWDVS